MTCRKQIERERLRREQQITEQEAGPAGTLPSDTGAGEQQRIDEGSCVVCLENASCMAFTECGHQCVCERCSAAVNRCPLCRKGGRCIRIYTA